jgi:hypothetical protein
MTAPDEICDSSVGTVVAGNPCHLSPPGDTLGFEDWRYVINFRPPSGVTSTLKTRFHSGPMPLTPEIIYHQIELGTGDINLDFYPVYIQTLPNDAGGNQMSANGTLDYIRTHMGDFMDNSSSGHNPLAGSGANVYLKPYADQDVTQWASSSPLGTVMHFGIGGANWEVTVKENLSVVAAEMAADHWIFTTIWTPKDLGHPVSGNRQFGMATRRVGDTYSQQYGLVFGDPVTTDTLYFYTRGADRCTTIGDWALHTTVFMGGHMCWLGLQRRVRNWIVANGGQASFPNAAPQPANPYVPTDPTTDTVNCISGRNDWGSISKAYWDSPSP